MGRSVCLKQIMIQLRHSICGDLIDILLETLVTADTKTALSNAILVKLKDLKKWEKLVRLPYLELLRIFMLMYGRVQKVTMKKMKDEDLKYIGCHDESKYGTIVNCFLVNAL